MIDKKQQEDYIRERNIFLNDNIAEYHIGQKIIDTGEGRNNVITEITKIEGNSIEVFIAARDKDVEYEKRKGISYKQWYYIKDFNSRFKRV